MNKVEKPEVTRRRQRLKEWFATRSIPAKDKSYISQLANGSASFGEKAVARLENEYGMPEGYLNGVATINDGSKGIIIAQYDAGGSMGHGRLALEDGQPGVIKSWHVDSEWLRLNVGHYTSAANLCIVTGFGPSMRPRFNPGDPLLMDCGIKSVDTDGIYFFRVADCGYIKQLQRIPAEKGTVYRAKSYNSDYEPFDITKKMDFEVFGKILTIWRSEQV